MAFCFNDILNRTHIKNDIVSKLDVIEQNKYSKNMKRAFFISGDCGVGKTEFVKKLLSEMDYDVLHYNACDVRNKSVIESLAMHNLSNTNVASMFYKKKRKLAILMDEIDGMNSGDKGGITSLIALIRPKKTKKQLMEPLCNNPIICISTNDIDKKTKELIKVCNSYEFSRPTDEQILSIIKGLFHKLPEKFYAYLVTYAQNDLRKLSYLHSIYEKDANNIQQLLQLDVFAKKSIIEIAKDTVRTTYQTRVPISDHNMCISENDRTIVAMLWHENICDILKYEDKHSVFRFYQKLLENFCYGDFIDRVTFQKQIWQFNEMSSFMKIMHNNYLIHDNFCVKKKQEIRFTKILTKYSTEFNNYSFFQSVSNILLIDKKDIITLFNFIRGNEQMEQMLMNNYEIKELDIQRIYRYIDNHVGQ